MGSAFTDAVAAEPGVLVVGTDAAEWWDNPGDVLRALQAQSGELQGAAATVSHCRGWAQGDIGWGAVKADIVFAGGPAASIRITAVLAHDPGGWKIVQFPRLTPTRRSWPSAGPAATPDRCRAASCG
jgi:hypothetical protein